VQAYRALAAQIGALLFDTSQSCRDPIQVTQCRSTVVGLQTADTSALSLLASATVPARFQTLHQALTDAITKALAKAAVTALDSGDKQAMSSALSAFRRNYSENIANIVDHIQTLP
jgi:hypothetical protein